jgi:hypothetical protein
MEGSHSGQRNAFSYSLIAKRPLGGRLREDCQRDTWSDNEVGQQGECTMTIERYLWRSKKSDMKVLDIDKSGRVSLSQARGE